MAEDTTTKPTARMIAEQKAKEAKEGRMTKTADEDTMARLQERIKHYNPEGARKEIDELNKKIAATQKEWNWAYSGGHGGAQYTGSLERKMKAYRNQINSIESSRLDKAAEVEKAMGRQGGTGVVQRLLGEGFNSGSKIEQEMLRGARTGEAILGKEGLGRLSEDADVLEAMQRYKDISEQGLSRAEVEAEKSQAFKEIQGSTETARRQLQAQLARMGVRGGVAGAQTRDVLMKGMAQQADVSRDLFLKSEQIKRQGLADYSGRLGEMKTFDLGQEAAEKNIVLQTSLGMTQIGSSERAAKYAAEQQRLAAQARSSAGGCFLKQTKVKLKDGTEKNISNVAIGDELETGFVTGVLAFALQENVYDVNGVFVTGSHYVFDSDGKWKTVQELGCPVVITSDEFVYTLTTTSGTLNFNGVLFSDHEGFAESDKIDEYILGEMNEFTKDVLSREVRSEATGE